MQRIDYEDISSHLTGARCVADELELRGFIGDPSTSLRDDGDPLRWAVGRWRMAMLRHRAAKSTTVDARCSSSQVARRSLLSQRLWLAAGDGLVSAIGLKAAVGHVAAPAAGRVPFAGRRNVAEMNARSCAVLKLESHEPWTLEAMKRLRHARASG